MRINLGLEKFQFRQPLLFLSGKLQHHRLPVDALFLDLTGRLNIDPHAGQLHGQTGVFALLADRQRQLVVLNDD